MSIPPSPPLLLASTSPQRRAILTQLGIPFDEVAPRYEEHDPPDADAVRLVRDHALGKARSVAGEAGDRPVLGSTGRVCSSTPHLREAEGRGDESRCSRSHGRTHAVVGIALYPAAWEHVDDATTLVTFRKLTPRDLAWYIGFGEWEGRAGGYAIQGHGAALVERIEGDYSNVVGLPTALLVRLLAEKFPGLYGFG